jgi:hypothetical protein
MDQYATGNVQFPSYQAPGLPPLNAPDFNINTGDPSSYYNPAPSTSGGANWQNGYGAGGGYSQGGGGVIDPVSLNPGNGYQQSPDFGGLHSPDFTIHTGGNTGGMTPSTTGGLTPPSYTPPDWSTYLNAPDLTIKTDNSGGNGGGNSAGHSTGSTGGMSHGSGGGGMYTSGTLSGGYAVDPSQWGAFGIGGDSGPVNGGVGQGYALQLLSGGMHEGGGFGQGASFLAGRRVPRGVPPRTGGGGQISG